MAVTVLIAGSIIKEQLDLGGAALIELGGAVLAEDLELKAVGMAGCNPGDFEASGTVGELRIEGCIVVILDRFERVADGHVIVTHDGAQRKGPLGNRCCEPATAN